MEVKKINNITNRIFVSFSILGAATLTLFVFSMLRCEWFASFLIDFFTGVAGYDLGINTTIMFENLDFFWALFIPSFSFLIFLITLTLRIWLNRAIKGKSSASASTKKKVIVPESVKKAASSVKGKIKKETKEVIEVVTEKINEKVEKTANEIKTNLSTSERIKQFADNMRNSKKK